MFKCNNKNTLIVDGTTKRFVELDGVFWYGLDKPHEELYPNGKAAYDRDRRRDVWFEANSLKLFRITNKEFLAAQKMNIFSEIVQN